MNPCLNGASCQASGSNYICVCQQFYSGTNCQVYQNPCQNSLCLNGATCNPTGTGSTYECTCRSGYSGDNCGTCITDFNNF